MAGSRLTNFGTIFSRTTGLLQGGALKETPIWYDVYRKYPPELEPDAERPVPPQEPIPELVYEEDFERAQRSGTKYKFKKVKTTVKVEAADIIKDIN